MFLGTYPDVLIFGDEDGCAFVQQRTTVRPRSLEVVRVRNRDVVARSESPIDITVTIVNDVRIMNARTNT
jgi:hypothetical protein